MSTPSEPGRDTPLARQQAARRAVTELFLHNAAAGDDASNDALIAELCRRSRAQRQDQKEGP